MAKDSVAEVIRPGDEETASDLEMGSEMNDTGSNTFSSSASQAEEEHSLLKNATTTRARDADGSFDKQNEVEKQRRSTDWADKIQLPVWGLHLLLVVAQFMFGSFHAITSLALRKGNDAFAVACLRETVSLPILVLLGLLLEPTWPEYSHSLLLRVIVLAFVSLVGVRLLVYVGILYASPELTSTLIQSSPIVTMLMCVAIGTERLLIRRQSGICKVASLMCVATATALMAFWNGPAVVHGVDKVGFTKEQDGDYTRQDKQVGIFAIFINVLCFGVFAIMQKALLDVFPIVKLQATLAVFGVPMLYAIVAPFKSASAWNLNGYGWLGAVYGGIVSSVIAYLVITMCNRKLDPVSVVCYLPLQPLMASLIGTTLLGDDLHASLMVAAVFLLSSVFLLVRGKLLDKRDEAQLGTDFTRSLQRKLGNRTASLLHVMKLQKSQSTAYTLNMNTPASEENGEVEMDGSVSSSR